MRNNQASLAPQLNRTIISSLRPTDTFLRPAQHMSQLLAFVSSWVDIVSSDPLVADASRQILNLEVAYAAFCGITNIVISSPALENSKNIPADAAKFAHAIRHLLTLSPHVQIHILISLGSQCSRSETEEYGSLVTASSGHHDLVDTVDQEGQPRLSSWSFWNTVRSICKYNSRLSVGKRMCYYCLEIAEILKGDVTFVLLSYPFYA